MRKSRCLTVPRRLVGAFVSLLLVCHVLAAQDTPLEFVVAGDMRGFSVNPKNDGRRFFDGVCEAMKRVGPGAFLISPGDFDPPAPNRRLLDQYFGPDYPWYVAVGNHEVENAAAMPWVREWLASDIPHLVRRGVPGTKLTVYSWDWGNSHFIAIDSYPLAVEGTRGGDGKPAVRGNRGQIDLTEAEFRWLEEDLAATHQPFIFIFGHQPIESIPDMDTGRRRHSADSVSLNPKHAARFIALVKKFHVRAYLCGHTHNTSVVKLKSGIWQCDSGHARGGGDPGAPSTFLKFHVGGDAPSVDIYRADPMGREYTLRKTVVLD